MVNLFKYLRLSLSLLLLTTSTHAQNYHALHGSSYAGSLGVAMNPASIINTPYKWDVTLFGGQLKYSTNIVSIFKYSLITNATRSEYLINNGVFDRYGIMNFNVRLLNARYTINRKLAVAAGINVRSYANLVPSAYNFIDTIKTVNHFLRVNNPSALYNLDFVNSAWIETYGTASRTVIETETGRLSVGLTVKAMRGISGVYAEMNDVGATSQGAGEPYVLTSGDARFSYSSNYDTWRNRNSTTTNVRNFISHSQGGLSFDIGAEYLVKPGGIGNFNEPDDYYHYDWKIGLSLLDLGKNNFRYGIYSRDYTGVIPQATDALLQQKFRSIQSIPQLTDSLASVTVNPRTPSGRFSIMTPARMILNVDRYLSGNFYLNTELSLNLPSMKTKQDITASEFNLLAVTPRWERSRFGFYLPVLYNTKKRAWVGGAVKAGPLLFGIHNWGNVFSTKKMQRGGGYIAVVIRPGTFFDGPKDRRLDCPETN